MKDVTKKVHKAMLDKRFTVDEMLMYGYTLTDEWSVERWEVRVEDFCTVFNSSESLASDSLAGENSYVFTTLKERNMWADIQDKRFKQKLEEDYYDKPMDEYRDKGMSPGDFFREN